MILIAHRGNTSGPNPEKENNPQYVDKAIDSGYNVGYINGTAQNISGFAGKNALKNQDNTMVFGEERLGKGSIIYMVDNPMFRSFWENGKLLLVNAIFYVNNSKVRI